jgi:ribosomal protein S18 acetylase RimI-like enzyme
MCNKESIVMSYVIRAAKPEELEQIIALYPRLSAFDIPERRNPDDLWMGDAELVKAWANGDTHDIIILVASNDEGQILGVAMARLRDELMSHAPSAHLESIAVSPQAEGQGIGGKLIDAIEQAVRERGAQSLTLHVFNKNTRARSLYQRKGFDEELIRAIKYLD